MNDNTDVENRLTGRPDAAACRLAMQRVGDLRTLADAARPLLPGFLTDADRYRWIRANRGHIAIEEALKYSDRDSDFDERIAQAIRLSAAGRHYFSHEFGALG